MKFSRIFFAVAVAGFTIQPAFAHRFWIVPSSSVLSGDQPWASFDAAVSNDLFFPNHVAPELATLNATDPNGKNAELQNGCVGKYRTTFDVQLKTPGTYRIATVRSLLLASWEDNGETKKWRGAPEKIAEVQDKPDVQLTTSRSRVECFVTSGEPTTPKPTGEGLELVFDQTHPNDLYAGEGATFTLHNQGQPAAGLEVTVIQGNDRYRDEVGEITATTDESGKFTIKWPSAGRFWLNVSTESDGSPVAGMPTKSRSSYTATFEVLPQ